MPPTFTPHPPPPSHSYDNGTEIGVSQQVLAYFQKPKETPPKQREQRPIFGILLPEDVQQEKGRPTSRSQSKTRRKRYSVVHKPTFSESTRRLRRSKEKVNSLELPGCFQRTNGRPKHQPPRHPQTVNTSALCHLSPWTMISKGRVHTATTPRPEDETKIAQMRPGTPPQAPNKHPTRSHAAPNWAQNLEYQKSKRLVGQGGGLYNRLIGHRPNQTPPVKNKKKESTAKNNNLHPPRTLYGGVGGSLKYFVVLCSTLYYFVVLRSTS